MPVQPGMQFHWANQWGPTRQTSERPLDTCLIRLFVQWHATGQTSERHPYCFSGAVPRPVAPSLVAQFPFTGLPGDDSPGPGHKVEVLALRMLTRAVMDT
jgi:hypothetical protein